ncbi:MAG: hypothetical protein LBN37_03285, partial [Bacteroidales bacterium]|nr:hypothetical protein [Bacteroidales bacterium]
MEYYIRIGNPEYRLKLLDSVKIVKSVENLADTATIVIPGARMNIPLNFGEKIHEGDNVTIELGYDGNLQEEFKGYLKSISTDGGSISLECEDGLYVFRVTLENKEHKGIGLKSLLKLVVNEVNKINGATGNSTNYTVECDYEFGYDKFVVFRATAYDVLKKVQEETKANIYFAGDVLHVHPPYAEISNAKAVNFDFARNIEKSDLKYVESKDKNIEVEVTVLFPDGTRQTEKFGQPGGIKTTKTVSTTDRESMKRVAESEYNLWVYDGYEGSFTGWLIPYVEPAMKIHLHDADYPKKDGDYYVV